MYIYIDYIIYSFKKYILKKIYYLKNFATNKMIDNLLYWNERI